MVSPEAIWLEFTKHMGYERASPEYTFEFNNRIQNHKKLNHEKEFNFSHGKSRGYANDHDQPACSVNVKRRYS
jgi:hypothetical protein